MAAKPSVPFTGGKSSCLHPKFTPSVAYYNMCRRPSGKGWGDKQTRAGIHGIICGMIDFGKLNDRGTDPICGVEMVE